MRVAETQPRRLHCSGNSVSGSSDSRSPEAVSAAGAEPLHRLLPEGLQPLLVDVGGAHASHLSRHGCHFWPSRQGLMGRERPSQAVRARVKIVLAAVPIREAKRGGRSRPPPISPSGTADPGIWPQLNERQRDRGRRLCESSGPLFVNPPRMSVSHSWIGTGPPLRTPETSLRKPLRPPSVVTVDHDLDGAILCHRLQLDRPLQRGRPAAVGVENPRRLRERGYRFRAQRGVARNRLIVVSSIQSGKVLIHTGQRGRRPLFSVNGNSPEGRHLQFTAPPLRTITTTS